MVNAVAVPDRLEQAVGEAQRHDVLHRLFPQKVIDAVDLFFLEILAQAAVEIARRLQVVAERLFHDDAAKALFIRRNQSRFAKLLGDGGEEAVGGGQVKKDVALEVLVLVNLRQQGLQVLVGLGLFEIALQEGHAGRDGIPQRLVHLGDFAFAALVQPAFQEIAQVVLPLLAGPVVMVHPDQRQPLRQHAGARQVVERRHDQPLGQVAIGAEDHDRGGRRRRLVRQGAHLSSSLALCAGTTLSMWPPNSLRMADSSFSPKVLSLRERKRE